MLLQLQRPRLPDACPASYSHQHSPRCRPAAHLHPLLPLLQVLHWGSCCCRGTVVRCLCLGHAPHHQQQQQQWVTPEHHQLHQLQQRSSAGASSSLHPSLLLQHHQLPFGPVLDCRSRPLLLLLQPCLLLLLLE